MKKFLIIILFVFNTAVGLLTAQSYVQLNNFWENTYYINPSAINDQYLAEFKMAARQQWFNLQGAPITYFGSATIYNERMNTQYGVKVLQDKIGYTTVSSIDLTYAYAIQLQWDMQINLGLAFNYQNLSNDLSNVKMNNTTDSYIYQKLSSTDLGNNFNGGIGAELTSKYWRVGVSTQNLASLILPQKGLFLNTNYIYTMYRQYTSNYVNFGFGLCGVQVGAVNQLQLTATSYFNTEGQSNPFQPGGAKSGSVFQIGVFYRTMSELGGVFGIDLGSNVFLAYSFDYNLGGISRSTFGTHEIMLTYRLNKKRVCRTCWY